MKKHIPNKLKHTRKLSKTKQTVEKHIQNKRNTKHQPSRTQADTKENTQKQTKKDNIKEAEGTRGRRVIPAPGFGL